MPLTWSENRQACEECRYDHCVSETPLGKLYIEWKGWKDYPSPMCQMPWGEVVVGDNVNETKENVQVAWDSMVESVTALKS